MRIPSSAYVSEAPMLSPRSRTKRYSVRRVVGLTVLIGLAIIIVSLYQLLPHPEDAPIHNPLKQPFSGNSGTVAFQGPALLQNDRGSEPVIARRTDEVRSDPARIVPRSYFDAPKIAVHSETLASASVIPEPRREDKPTSPAPTALSYSLPPKVEAEPHPHELTMDKSALVTADESSSMAPNVSTYWRLNELVPEVVMSKRWVEEFFAPSQCFEDPRRTIFFFHHRKAAGTTLRTYFRIVQKVKYMESEGVSLPHSFKRQPGLITVTSLRDPIDRVLSLYWYEHVAWWLDVKKNDSLCLDLPTWLASWSDDSPWKVNYGKKFPRNTYIEVSNYYVKSLSGWTGEAAPTEQDLEVAKQKLEEFDIVLITDWMYNSSTQVLLKSIFQRSLPQMRSALLTNSGNKQNLPERKAKLIPALKEEIIMQRLLDMNRLDLELFDYARRLVMERQNIANIYGAFKMTKFYTVDTSTSVEAANVFFRSLAVKNPEKGFCEQAKPMYSTAAYWTTVSLSPKYLNATVGLYQTPGHKGPAPEDASSMIGI